MERFFRNDGAAEDGCGVAGGSGAQTCTARSVGQIRGQIHPVRILNNMDWYDVFSVPDFLRTVGRHFRLGTMLARDTVRSRMESGDGESASVHLSQCRTMHLTAFNFSLPHFSASQGSASRSSHIL
jgi:hypothetical protein